MEASPLMIDIYEPMEIYEFLSSNIPANREPINSWGLCDFYWVTDHKITLERKSASDLIGSIVDGSLEERLKLGFKNADEVGLISEGIFTPCKGGTSIWCQSKDGKLYFKQRTLKVSYLEVAALLYRLDKEGITTYCTADLDSTSRFLLAAYNNSKKDEHLTFRRYLKPKPHYTDQDPFLRNIMSISGIGIDKAQALLLVYDTPWKVYNADIAFLAAIIGDSAAKKLLKGIGKND